MIVKRKIYLRLIVLIVSIFTFVTGCSNEAASTQKGNSSPDTIPKEIRIGYQISPNGELLAKALGLLEKKYPDTKVSWIKFDSGRDVNNAIASGSIDFGL